MNFTLMDLTPEELGALRFPGSVEGVLQPGSITIVPFEDYGRGVVVRPDEEHPECRVWWCAENVRIGMRGLPNVDLELDLTNATSRQHLEWWLEASGWWLRMWGSSQPWSSLLEAWRNPITERGDCRPVNYKAWRKVYAVLTHLDVDDTRTLSDGSRWVDAMVLSLIVRHVAGLESAR